MVVLQFHSSVWRDPDFRAHGRNPYHKWVHAAVTPRASKLHLFVVGPVAKAQLAPRQERGAEEVRHIHHRLLRHRDRRRLQLLCEAIAEINPPCVSI